MNEGRQTYVAGVACDLGFAFVTYMVLGTILGICALVFRPTLEPIVGDSAAGVWWLAVTVGYCVWQFLRFRRLRRLEPLTSENPRLA
jgi:ABC-type thiamin/hydroxymethylpyrimidine transport system permease subunit